MGVGRLPGLLRVHDFSEMMAPPSGRLRSPSASRRRSIPTIEIQHPPWTSPPAPKTPDDPAAASTLDANKSPSQSSMEKLKQVGKARERALFRRKCTTDPPATHRLSLIHI